MKISKHDYKWPLMYNNITDEDIKSLVDFLSQQPMPILTNSKKVIEFEKLWSEWLGIKYSVFVNSGSSANTITTLILKHLFRDKNEIIVPPLTWVSDIASILHAGLNPVFSDINLKNLALDGSLLESKITEKTSAIFLTHILGYNGITDEILDICKRNKVALVEDVCESHGATFKGKKLGTFGLISNFSFYYAHHMTSIEGGMICTDDQNVYELARILRSHGLLRESTDMVLKQYVIDANPDLNKDFIFVYPAHNMRSTEINAVLAINQLNRLDNNNEKRAHSLNVFLDNLDPKKYFVEFDREGNSNYAFTLLLKSPDFELRNKIEKLMYEKSIEFRRGMSGGGNQLRQPYLKDLFCGEYKNHPVCDHVHHFGWYIGNYPDLEEEKIIKLTNILNNI